MHKHQITWIIAVMVSPALMTNAQVAAAPLVLNKVDIQSLRYLKQMHDPPILGSLSSVGRTALFEKSARGLDSIVVEGSGLWRCRGVFDRTLKDCGMGNRADSALLRMLLECESGAVPTTDLEIPESVAEDMEYYIRIAGLRIGGGWPTQRRGEFYRELFTSGNKREDTRDVRLLAEVFRELPESFRKATLTDAQQQLLAGWIDDIEKQENRVAGLLLHAIPADKTRLSGFQLSPVYDSGTKQLLFPVPTKRVKASKNLFIVPSEGLNKLFIRVKEGSDLTEDDLQDAYADQFLRWMKRGKVDIFVEGKDSPMKISHEQMKQRLEQLKGQFNPGK